MSDSLEYPNPSIPISTHAASAAIDKIDKKPKFSEFLCDSWRVENFVLSVVRETIPRQFWGSRANVAAVEERKHLTEHSVCFAVLGTNTDTVFLQTLSLSCAFGGTST